MISGSEQGGEGRRTPRSGHGKMEGCGQVVLVCMWRRDQVCFIWLVDKAHKVSLGLWISVNFAHLWKAYCIGFQAVL